MSAYIICYDPKNNVSIRTTSEIIANKLKRLYPHTIEIAKVSGHDCEVHRRNDCDNLTFNEYCLKYPVGLKNIKQEREMY